MEKIPFLYNITYDFTLTIEIIVRHYNRLSLLFILLSNNYIDVSILLECIAITKVMCIFVHLYIRILTPFDEF